MTRPELLAAVLAEPDVLWAIAGQLRQLDDGLTVAGPWARTKHESVRFGTYEDRDYGASIHAWARRFRATKRLPERWYAYVDPEGRTIRPDFSGSEPHPTREAAEAWCDARLREAGVLLATGTLTTTGDNDAESL